MRPDAARFSPSRRALIRMSLAGALGSTLGLRASDGAQAILSASERATLSAVADALVPGAAKAGVADFVTAMLADPDPMLCYRFVSLPMTPLDFYRASLDAIGALSVRTMHQSVDALASAQRTTLIGQMLSASLEGWNGPPTPLVYFVIRNDAIDAVYGDEGAYDRLDVPYMAHIAPPGRW